MFTSISHIGSGLGTNAVVTELIGPVEKTTVTKDICVVFNFTFFPFGEKKKGLKHEFNPVFKEAAVNPGI